MKKILWCLVVFAVGPLYADGRARASSNDAWRDFREEVAATCGAAFGDLKKYRMVVDPFGSAGYGFAMAFTDESGATLPYVCVFDKKTKKVEVLDLNEARLNPAEIEDAETVVGYEKEACPD